MGTWTWDDIPNQRRLELSTAPAAASLAASIVPTGTIDAAYEERVQRATELPQLAIEEWSVSAEVQGIFEILRSHGSKFGCIVEDGNEQNDYLQIALTSENAAAIATDLAMDMPMAFVDDQRLCSMVSYWDDYALIGMRADLFDRWLFRTPLDLTLRADGPRYPKATNYEEAKVAAKRRNEKWAEICR